MGRHVCRYLQLRHCHAATPLRHPHEARKGMPYESRASPAWQDSLPATRRCEAPAR
jgi:hypothetical protein